MWLPEPLLRHLDRGESRGELARFATAVVIATNRDLDAEFFWDDTWIWRIGQYYYPFADQLPKREPNWGKLIALAGRRERDSTDYWFHVYQPRSGDVILDIGAGAGEDVHAFSAAVGPEGCVLAIEAHPLTFRRLEKFCAFNKLTDVRCLNYACMDGPGECQIDTGPRPISNYVWRGHPNAASLSTPGRRLDNLCDDLKLDQVTFLKINIEGAERMALPGAVEVLRKTRYVCIAAHDFRADRGDGEHFRTAGFVKEFLSTMGFQLAIRSDDTREWVPNHIHGIRI